VMRCFEDHFGPPLWHTKSQRRAIDDKNQADSQQYPAIRIQGTFSLGRISGSVVLSHFSIYPSILDLLQINITK
jgi:hypothetical protein